jgi:2,3-bisphosphoglycerate-independent phosphoglycerate mutase
MSADKKAALIILDGWGQRDESESNAVAKALTPNLDRLCASCECTTLGASGMDVGLPDGQMGNSEVGHLNLGSGRIVYQDFTRINLAISEGDFFDNTELNGACDAAVEGGKALHLIGLLSDGGVHSHQEHLYALVDLAKRRGVKNLYIHAILDGRDTPPQSGLGYVQKLEEVLAEKGLGRIATVSGRFYPMDRDTRWERVERAYRALCRGEGNHADCAAEAVRAAYDADQTDEFVEPTVITHSEAPVALLSDGDALIFFNFRSDRARQLTRALTISGFDGFDAADRPTLSRYVCFTEYDETFNLPVAFPPQELHNILAEVLAEAGRTQLRIAETEKYAHVTFFFNGGAEKSFPGEERVLIESARDIQTYDQRPRMAAFEVRDRLLEEIDRGVHDVIVLNLANLDMVGHTGMMAATIEAVEVVDECVGDIVERLRAGGYATLVTADHGNAEQMWDGEGQQPMTAHTTNRVPLVLVPVPVDNSTRAGACLRSGGRLADVAPTLLDLLGLDKPDEMTGTSLII